MKEFYLVPFGKQGVYPKATAERECVCTHALPFPILSVENNKLKSLLKALRNADNCDLQ